MYRIRTKSSTVIMFDLFRIFLEVRPFQRSNIFTIPVLSQWRLHQLWQHYRGNYTTPTVFQENHQIERYHPKGDYDTMNVTHRWVRGYPGYGGKRKRERENCGGCVVEVRSHHCHTLFFCVCKPRNERALLFQVTLFFFVVPFGRLSPLSFVAHHG